MMTDPCSASFNLAADLLDMAAVNIAVGFRPSVREDIQRCDDFIRGLKWFEGGTLPEGVNCERSPFSRLVALTTVAAGGAGRSNGAATTGRDGPLATTAAPTTAAPTAQAPLPPVDAGTPLPLLPPALLPTAPTTPTTRPPGGQPPAGGPPSSDPAPPTSGSEPAPTIPETTTTAPETTTTTTPETTSTTSDIPPEWTDPTGGGINP